MPIARQGKSITGSWEGKSITGSWEGKSITGSWARLSQFSNSKPPFPVSTMLLLTNGTVMCQEAFTNVNDGKKNFPPSNRWSLLSPDESGDYVHGSWSDLSPMYNSRNFYASAVLADGRVFVAGGEYSDDKNKTIDLNGREGGWTNKCKIYNPLLNIWSSIPSPDKWGNIGDAPCCVLPDGRVILGIPYEPVKSDTRTAIYDPAEYDPAKAWSSSANKY